MLIIMSKKLMHVDLRCGSTVIINQKCTVYYNLIIIIYYLLFSFMFKKEQQQEAVTNGRWTKEEHRLFLEGLQLYGKNWKKIQPLIKSRTGSQIRSHAQKYFNKLERRRDDPRHFFDSNSHTNMLQETIPLRAESRSQEGKYPIETLMEETQNRKNPDDTDLQTMQLEKKQNQHKKKTYEPSYFMQKMKELPLKTLFHNFFQVLVDTPSSRKTDPRTMLLQNYRGA